MPESQWYCDDCGIHGGGPPNNQTIEEHIDQVHDGFVAHIIEGTWRDWERQERYRL